MRVNRPHVCVLKLFYRKLKAAFFRSTTAMTRVAEWKVGQHNPNLKQWKSSNSTLLEFRDRAKQRRRQVTAKEPPRNPPPPSTIVFVVLIYSLSSRFTFLALGFWAWPVLRPAPASGYSVSIIGSLLLVKKLVTRNFFKQTASRDRTRIRPT